MRTTLKQSIMPAWPVLLALGLVGVLITAMVGLDVLLGQRVSDETDEIIGNSQRSIVLLDAIRTNAQNLSEPGISATEAHRRNDAIASEAREYDLLASYEGEAAEWEHLKRVVRTLAATTTQAESGPLADEVDRSVDRLIAINSEVGQRNAKAIHAAHRGAIRDDAVVGALALALVSLISVVLIRVLGRQRQMMADRVLALDEKTRDLEAFAGRAAHDLRSPMNPIRGYADLMLEASESEDVKMMARRIRTAVDRMARVVDDMLALSTAGRPGPGTCASSELATSVIDDLGPELHGVELTAELAGGNVSCSGGMLGQILRNLIGNAIKFRDRARPLQLRLTLRRMAADVEIVLEDNGVGMDEDTAAHAFEPLYRGGRTDREVPGHGLGLAIVERATRALGGTCELTSVLDRGTRICVRLPAA